MDIPRDRQRFNPRTLRVGAGVAVLALLTLATLLLKPAELVVERGSVWIDSVRRGEMVIEVHAPGRLLPIHATYVSSLLSARVERILVKPGQGVGPGAVLFELSNPDVAIQALEAEQRLSEARAQLVGLRATLKGNQLTQEAILATADADYRKAQRDSFATDSLAASDLIPRNDALESRERANELATRYRVEQERLALMRATADSQLQVQALEVDHLRGIVAYQHRRLSSLHVRAGDSGVLSDISLEAGQWVTEGTALAKIIRPGELEAVLQVADVDAKDVAVGQAVKVDTRTDVVAGHVVRIDPASENGAVSVSVALDAPAPPGARPDLAVDGTIVIERLDNVLYTGHPAYATGNSTLDLFKLNRDGRTAVRVRVRIGRSAVNAVEVLAGLGPGDRVILSDMSQWGNASQLRLR